MTFFTDNKSNRSVLGVLPAKTLIPVILILLLILPAYLTNLGKLRLIDDESLRVIVGLEMKISGDYITPTVGGDNYFKKPPVFNWILASAYSVTGNYSELTQRITSLVFLFLFGLSVFFIIKKRYGLRAGYITALLFIANGRILIYESLFGLIDITYSWLIFCNFILIYSLRKRGKYLQLFIFSYVITAVAFLMKGIPTLAFQGITLLVAFIPEGKFRILLSWKHFISIFLLFLILGGYYYAFSVRNPGEISTLLSTLFKESADKSVVGFGIKDMFFHVFDYSFQILYNFVPPTLVVIFFFSKKPFNLIRNDPFLLYLSHVLIFNIIIYLISPISFMRYVIMFIPIVSLLFTVYYLKEKEGHTLHIRLLEILFMIFTATMLLGMPAFAIIKKTGFVNHAWLKVVVLMLGFVTTFVFMIRQKNIRIELMIISLLLTRIAFDWFILPSRVHNNWEIHAKLDSQRLARETADLPLYELRNGKTRYLPTPLLYYMTAEKQKIIRARDKMDIPGYYLVNDTSGKYSKFRVDSLFALPDMTLSLIKITNK